MCDNGHHHGRSDAVHCSAPQTTAVSEVALKFVIVVRNSNFMMMMMMNTLLPERIDDNWHIHLHLEHRHFVQRMENR